MKKRLDKWTVRRTENWLNFWAQRAVTSSMDTSGWPVISCAPQRPLLSPVLYNVFINDLADGTKYTFS